VFQYCYKAWGYPGTYLWFNNGADAIPVVGSLAQDEALARAFSNCRYFTHYMENMVKDLENENYLFANGTTDGGCKQVEVSAYGTSVCPDDDDGRCNTVANLQT